MPIHDPALLAQAELASAELRDMLLPVADPYLAARPATHCMHFGSVEALQHSYAVSAMSLLVLESGNYALVRPDVDPGPPADHLARAQQVAQMLFRGASAPLLQLMPFRASDESLRMSNMGFAALGSRPGSIHAGVVANRLYFLLHKSRGPAKAVGDPPEAGWLGGVLEAAWNAAGPPRQPQADQQPYFGERGAGTAPAVDAADSLFWNRWSDESIDPASFLPLTTADDERSAMKASAATALGSLMRHEASLYGAGRQHAIHGSPERLLHRYDVADLQLLVYESEKYSSIRVSARPRQGEDGPAFVGRVVGALLRRTPSLRFFEGTAPDEDMRFRGELSAEAHVPPIAVGGAILMRTMPEGRVIAGIHLSVPQVKGTSPLLDDHLKARWKNRGGP